jgi:hypothetical protein
LVLGHVVVTCDGTILKVNAQVFVDVFLAIVIMGEKNKLFHVPRLSCPRPLRQKKLKVFLCV